jgi:hypothetical protein
MTSTLEKTKKTFLGRAVNVGQGGDNRIIRVTAVEPAD